MISGWAGLRGFFRPALGDLLGIFLLILVLVFGIHRMFGDADAATHVATGLWILEHREIPKTDPFSATFAGKEWFAHEWLADLGMAIAYRAAGWAGVLVAAAILIAAAHVLLYRVLVGRGEDALVSFGAVVAAAAAACSHWLARPHLLTVLLLVAWVAVLEGVVRGERPVRRLAVLPPLAAVWANVHGGFVVAFGALGCYIAGTLLLARPMGPRGRATGPEVARARALLPPLAATFAATALATLVNPWGWRLPRHLVAFFAVRGKALQATTEFASATVEDRAGVGLVIFLILCLAGISCGARALALERRARALDGSPRARAPFHPGTLFGFAMATAMAVTSIRHVEVMAVFGAVVLAGGASALLRLKTGAETRAALEEVRVRESRSGGGLLALVAAGAVLHAGAGGLASAGFDPALFPVAMVRELKAEGAAPPGPVLTPDIWGGYLILEWPQARVYVDGRWDMRGDAFWSRYADIYLARPGWDRLLAEDGVGLAILPPDTPLAAAMRDDAGWVRWRSDATCVVLRRREPPAR